MTGSPLCPRKHKRDPMYLDRVTGTNWWECPGVTPDGSDCGYRTIGTGLTPAAADTIRRDPVGANLASLNDIIAEMVQAVVASGVGDQAFADVVRETLREHSWSLGYDFQGERDYSKAVPRPGVP